MAWIAGIRGVGDLAQKHRDRGVISSPIGGAGEGGLTARLLCLLIMTGQGIWTNKFQLFLTLLTMAVGSFALSLTFFLGDGARIYLWQDMEQLMGSWVVASPSAHFDSDILKIRRNADFTPGDIQFVKQHLKSARLVERFYQGSVPVSYRNVSRGMAIDGVTIDLSREPLFVPTKGHSFSEAGYQILVWECLLTESAVRALGIEIADNPTILIDGRPFHVVGVTPDPPGADDIFRPRITVPYSCARALWLPPTRSVKSSSPGEISTPWTKSPVGCAPRWRCAAGPIRISYRRLSSKFRRAEASSRIS
jgi:hypothetical protein